MRIPFAQILAHAMRLLFAAALLGLAPPHAAHGATVYNVPASIAGNCSTDVTAPLLSWIASVPDNSVLSFTSGACYRIEQTLEITNRHGLTFEGNGATFQATTVGGVHRSQWQLVEGSNFVLRNMTINGGDAGGAFDSALQHQHGIDLSGPSGVEIDHVNITNVPGDCFYVGQGWYTKRWSSDVHVHDSSCAHSRRMGVAVTAGRTVLVERTSFAQIGMTAFDIEPNGAGFGATGIRFANNQVRSIEMLDVLGDGPVDSVTVDNNTILGQGTHMAVIAQPGQRHTNITITGNTNDTAYSNAGSVAIDVIRVNGLTVTKNVIPLGAQNMALIDVSESCNVNVSGNSYPGGVAEARIHAYSGTCPAPPPAVIPPTTTPTGGTTGPTGSKATAAAKATAAMQLVGTAAKLPSARLSAPIRQTLSTVRRRGLLVRFRGDAAATWAFTATLRMAAKLHAARLRAARGVLARKSLNAKAGSGTVRLRIPRARLAGMGTLVIRVRARVSIGGKFVLRSVIVRITANAPEKTK